MIGLATLLSALLSRQKSQPDSEFLALIHLTEAGVNHDTVPSTSKEAINGPDSHE